MNKKGAGIQWDTLIPWLVGAAFLIIIGIVYGIASGKLEGLGRLADNLFRFGGGNG